MNLFSQAKNQWFSVDWGMVRALAELQVLTRVSYLMLVLVPILASVWPGVRLVVNQYNRAALDANAILDDTSRDLDRSLQEMRRLLRPEPTVSDFLLRRMTGLQEEAIESKLATIERIAQDLEARTHRFDQDYAVRTLSEPLLPLSWAHAFFAALLVMLGHLLYQSFAPEMVRRYTRDEFVNLRRTDFGAHPTSSQMHRARFFLQRYKARNPNVVFPHEREYQKLDGFAAVEGTDPETAEILEREGGERMVRRLGLIEDSAKIEYDWYALHYVWYSYLAFLLYMGGMGFVVWIIVAQTFNVMQASGYL